MSGFRQTFKNSVLPEMVELARKAAISTGLVSMCMAVTDGGSVDRAAFTGAALGAFLYLKDKGFFDEILTRYEYESENDAPKPSGPV